MESIQNPALKGLQTPAISKWARPDFTSHSASLGAPEKTTQKSFFKKEEELDRKPRIYLENSFKQNTKVILEDCLGLRGLRGSLAMAAMKKKTPLKVLEEVSYSFGFSCW